MLKLGVTGGIGSGKTVVCKIFASLGVPVYNADERAKALINSDERIRNAIIEKFGEKAFDGQYYNTKYISALVFDNKQLLADLNQIIHPGVLDDFSHWYIRQNYAYTVIESAILFESGFWKMMDYSLVVDAPEKVRIERVMKRDITTRKEIELRMHNQQLPGNMGKMANWRINNDDKTLILPQVLKIHKHLTGLK